MKMTAVLLVLACVIGALAYVRLAPTDTARWHVPVDATTDKDMIGGAVRVVPGDAQMLVRADAVMQNVPRTTKIAGSVETGRVTYVTRSKWIGFPDFTTLELRDGTLRMFARLRFGRSDFGVNRKRLQGLLAAIKE
ncbi:DUF1499 domain-containing protein [uncultured Tateyamaria sp.]|uniref:DUF1499 domain-containing protein n=1 Tax=uncultured Tateyamaria sp. TaxID=455651 RepID=UPI002632BD4B|nr:DUF1499 domain-containing protein [uncultured Tateyamaria sp.]